ncbi:MAG: histidine kinase [Gemmatimonadetes bacterium]|nr:histidine kinase [Gemmatimonadota bacterium]
MTAPSATARAEWRLRAWLLLFWFVPATMGTLGFVLVPSRLNPTLSVVSLFAAQVLIWSLWAVHTLVLWWVGDRLPWRPGSRLRAGGAYLALGVVVVVVQIFWQAICGTAFGIAERRGFESTLVIGLRSNGDYFVVIYCAVVVAQLATRWYAQWQAERIEAARLGEDLAQAHLRALQAQLNPHFLFNALNSIVTLIGRDPALAQQLVVRLADLLRATLKAGELQEVPLAQELEVTRRYLDIEQVRFADRLRVVWPHDPPAALVPAFALQPLVENALLHGIARQAGPGVIDIGARIAPAAEGDQLVLTVRDTGPGLRAPSASRGTGTGLANLRARLARLYGDASLLALHDRAEGGTEAVLRLPLRVVVVEPVAVGGSGMHQTRVGENAVPARG